MLLVFSQLFTETSWRDFLERKIDRANKKNEQANLWADIGLILQILFDVTFSVEIHNNILIHEGRFYDEYDFYIWSQRFFPEYGPVGTSVCFRAAAEFVVLNEQTQEHRG